MRESEKDTLLSENYELQVVLLNSCFTFIVEMVACFKNKPVFRRRKPAFVTHDNKASLCACDGMVSIPAIPYAQNVPLLLCHERFNEISSPVPPKTFKWHYGMFWACMVK